VRHIRALDGRKLPEDVASKAEHCLLDMIGCCLEAGDLPWSRQAAALARDVGGNPTATIIGSADRVTAAEAAFANAVQAHGLIREDMHPPSTSHIGVIVLPAAIALAESNRRSGAEFLSAVVAGYEAMGRLGRVLVDSQTARIFRPTGLVGPVGAAAATALLLRLNEDETVNALALAGNQAAGLNEWAHTATTEVFFHAGFAARGGIVAAMLASHGATGAESIVDGDAGMAAAYGGSTRLGALASNLGGPPEILSVYHKPAPACHFAQTPCQAALKLNREGCISPSDIERVEVRVSRAAADYPGCDQPGPVSSILEAKMSIQFGVASVLLTGRIEDANFRGFKVPALAALAKRIQVLADDGLTLASPDRQGAQVTAWLRNGRSVSAWQDCILPLEDAAVRERFRAASIKRLGAARTRDIEELVGGLRELADFSVLARLLTSSSNTSNDPVCGGHGNLGATK